MKSIRARWKKFVWPHGNRRQFSPKKWKFIDKVLIVGEFLALSAATASVWISGWPIVAAAMIGSSALLWYAFDLVSKGETPLTSKSSYAIRQVFGAVELERQGATFDWDNIDEDGGIPLDTESCPPDESGAEQSSAGSRYRGPWREGTNYLKGDIVVR